jgi:hypothetical protein
LHHSSHRVPFEDEPDDSFGDRRALKVEIGRLRRELAARDARIEVLEAELRSVQYKRQRKWGWL